MTPEPDSFERRRRRRELARLVREIQSLALEVHELRLRERRTPELAEKERALERLRWRLATTARRAAA